MKSQIERQLQVALSIPRAAADRSSTPLIPTSIATLPPFDFLDPPEGITDPYFVFYDGSGDGLGGWGFAVFEQIDGVFSGSLTDGDRLFVIPMMLTVWGLNFLTASNNIAELSGFGEAVLSAAL